MKGANTAHKHNLTLHTYLALAQCMALGVAASSQPSGLQAVDSVSKSNEWARVPTEWQHSTHGWLAVSLCHVQSGLHDAAAAEIRRGPMLFFTTRHHDCEEGDGTSLDHTSGVHMWLPHAVPCGTPCQQLQVRHIRSQSRLIHNARAVHCGACMVFGWLQQPLGPISLGSLNLGN